MKSKLKKDLNDKRIASICNNIFFLHKQEDIKCDTYIEYEILKKKYYNYAGNKNFDEDYVIQVDIFSKSNYFNLEKVLTDVLEEKGYYFLESADLYEDDTKLYHNASRWRYTILK